MVIPAIYKIANEFNEGNAIVKDKEGYMVLDKNSNTKRIITGRRITEIREFSDGLVAVMTGGKASNRYGYVNKEGVEVIKAQYIDCGDFIDGAAWVITKKERAGFINKKGDWIINPDYYRAKDMDPVSGFARVRGKHGWKYINMKGEELQTVFGESSRNFSEGFCAVKEDDNWGYMDSSGDVVILPKFDEKGFSKVSKIKITPLDILNPNPATKTKIEYYKTFFGYNDGVKKFSNGVALVRVNGKWGVINKKGEWLLPPIYEHLLPF